MRCLGRIYILIVLMLVVCIVSGVARFFLAPGRMLTVATPERNYYYYYYYYYLLQLGFHPVAVVLH
jgi:hypothetical protein